MNGSHSNNNKLKKNVSKQNPQQFTRAFFYCELINQQCAVLLLLDLFFFFYKLVEEFLLVSMLTLKKNPFMKHINLFAMRKREGTNRK